MKKIYLFYKYLFSKIFFKSFNNIYEIKNKLVYDLYNADQINLCYSYFKKFFNKVIFFSDEKKLLEFSCSCAIDLFKEIKISKELFNLFIPWILLSPKVILNSNIYHCLEYINLDLLTSIWFNINLNRNIRRERWFYLWTLSIQRRSFCNIKNWQVLRKSCTLKILLFFLIITVTIRLMKILQDELSNIFSAF